jgi:hypothetical protein
MKGNPLRIWLSISSLIMTSLAVAGTNELLLPVADSEVMLIEKRNERFLAEHRYFAKRHRIVRIDSKLLLTDGNEFTITPFPDSTYLVATKDIRRAPFQSVWSGIAINPSLPIDVFDSLSEEERQGMTVEKMKEVFLGISLTVTEYDLNTNTGEIVHAAKRPPMISPGGPNYEPPAAPAEMNFGAFQGVKGTIDIELLGGKYKLLPLKNDPEFHIVFEVNEEREITVVDPADRSEFAEEQRRRILEFQEYERQLDEAIVPNDNDGRGGEKQ